MNVRFTQRPEELMQEFAQIVREGGCPAAAKAIEEAERFRRAQVERAVRRFLEEDEREGAGD